MGHTSHFHKKILIPPSMIFQKIFWNSPKGKGNQQTRGTFEFAQPYIQTESKMQVTKVSK